MGFLALLFWGLPQAGATTFITGDLVIGGTDTRPGPETIDITGSVIIQSAGTATWTDVTVLFNSTSAGAHGLYVDGRATFTRVNISAAANTTAWWFKVNASSPLFKAESCDFSGMNGTAANPGISGTAAGTDFSALVGGVELFSDNARIGNSSIHDGLGANLYVSGASPRINNNHIFDAHYIAFETGSSYLAPRQTSDFNLVAACAVFASGQTDFDSNRVERCGVESSANATDLGASNATEATSNLQLVGAGLVVLGGSPSLRQDGITDIVKLTSSSSAFPLSGVNVTQYRYKVIAWGMLFKNAAGATQSGGFASNVDTGFEIYMDSSYGGGAVNFDLFLLTLNGTYANGFVANIGGFSQQVTLTLSAFSFGSGTAAAASVYFSSLGSPHSFSLTGAAIDQNGAGRGITVEDQNSVGKPTVTIAQNTISRTRAPISIDLRALTGGASLAVHNNSVNNTAAFYNGSAPPYYRGAIDLRWSSMTTGTFSALIEDNDIFNQTWQTGGTYFAGFTGYSFNNAALPTTITLRRNVFSNVSDAGYLYENYNGNALNAVYTFTDNLVQVAHGYGIFVEALSSGGPMDPAVDRNFIDRSDRNAIYWYLSSGNVVQKSFGNNTALGIGIGCACGFYFAYGTTQKWPLALADSLVFNASVGVQFAQVIGNIYRSNLSITTTAVICGDCVVRIWDSIVKPNSASVTGAGSEVTAFFPFGSPRVQWQGDGGLLITSGNLLIKYTGGSSPLTLATIPLDASATVVNRSIAAWRSTPGLPEAFSSLVPFIHVGTDDIAGSPINFTSDPANFTTANPRGGFYGNITLIDPLAATLTISTPGNNVQIRARQVVVKGTSFDALTGVGLVRISSDGVNFTNVSTFDPATGAWEHTLLFDADGAYTLSVRAWDRARLAIFPDFSSGFSEALVTGLVIDTVAPRLVLDQPYADITIHDSSYLIRGSATDLNTIAVFRLTFNGADLPVLPDGIGIFQVTVGSLKEGPNLISVLATDLAGNTNVLTRTIILDTIPPHLIVLAPLNNSFTNRAGIEVSGEVESDVLLFVNGANASFPYPLRLNQGLNRIWVNATDRGNNTASIMLLVTLDQTAPTVTFTAPARFPFATRDPHVTIRGQASEPLASLFVNGVEYPLQGAAPQQFSFELYLEDGVHSILVHVTDLANNSFDVAATPVIVDTQPPSLRLDSPADRTVQSSRTITFRGRTDPNAFLNVTSVVGVSQLNVNPITGEFSYPDTRTSDGVFVYVFEASDGVGNIRSVTLQITVDTTPPSIEILGIPPDFETASELVDLHGTVSPGARLTLTVSGPDPTLSASGTPVALDCTAGEGTPCTYSFNLRVAAGLSTVSIVATDLAGNQAVKEVHIKRDAPVTTAASGAAAPLSPFLLIAGLAVGLALLPLLMRKYRADAQKANPELELGKRAPAPVAAPVPVQQEVVYEEPHPQDMYATDAAARQPRAPRPPRPPTGGA